MGTRNTYSFPILLLFHSSRRPIFPPAPLLFTRIYREVYTLFMQSQENPISVIYDRILFTRAEQHARLLTRLFSDRSMYPSWSYLAITLSKKVKLLAFLRIMNATFHAALCAVCDAITTICLPA
jgi:hypothetical protein